MSILMRTVTHLNCLVLRVAVKLDEMTHRAGLFLMQHTHTHSHSHTHTHTHIHTHTHARTHKGEKELICVCELLQCPTECLAVKLELMRQIHFAGSFQMMWDFPALRQSRQPP